MTCDPVTLVDIAEGDRIETSLLGGTYTVGIPADVLTYEAGAAANVPASPVDGQIYYVTDNTRLSGSGVVEPHASVAAGPGLWMYDNRWNPPWNLPWGVMGYAEITANQTGITAIVDVTGLSLTWTAAANRRYKITTKAYVTSSVALDAVAVAITTGGGVQVQSTGTHVHLAGTSYGVVLEAVVTGVAAGSATYKVRALRSAGTGSCSIVAHSTYPAFILVEDIGPNGVPA